METVFGLSSWLVLPIWAAMIFLPRWRWTERAVASPYVAVGPALLYVVLVAPLLADALPVLARPTLPGVAALLGSPAGATAAWAHFLAFDLFVGRWIYLDARAAHIAAPIVSVLLAATLLVGPAGYVSYLAIRSATRRGLVARALGAARRIDRSSPTLWRASIAFAALTAGFGLLTLVDDRTILGIDPWVKPSKFAVSIAIYLATAAWLVGPLALSPARRRFVELALVGTMTIEMVLIAGQSARGTTSHFNVSTPLDATVFATMGVVIGFAALVAASVLYEYVVRPPEMERALLWGVRLGLAVFLLANVEGAFMAAHHSHAVGVADGGPGLPVVNWSTVGGDLRIAHFAGLHAIQALPLLGWALGRRALAMEVTVAAGVIYALVVTGLFLLALGEIPLVRV